MTFMRWHLVKYLEGVIAAYALAVGALFLLDPAALNAEVYDPWQGVGAIAWGAALSATALGHFVALWLNGRARVASRVVRAVANFLHLYVSLQFAWFFVLGNAPWGALTFTILMIGLILPILATTIEDARSAIDARR